MASTLRMEFWFSNMSLKKSKQDLEYLLIPTPEKSPNRFEQLRLLMLKLRSPEGCPWDREQTLETLQKYVKEEATEVAEAMQNVYDDPSDDNWNDLCVEVGDLLLECLFVAQFGQEAGKFDIYDALEALRKKMVRRHPHVFSDVSAETSDDVLKNWEQIKQQEKTR